MKFLKKAFGIIIDFICHFHKWNLWVKYTRSNETFRERVCITCGKYQRREIIKGE